MEVSKHNNQQHKSTHNVDSIDFFEVNHLYTFLYKKSEKLASALYMVTNFIPQEEILRKLLREKSINIFSSIMQLQNMSFKKDQRLRADTSAHERYASIDVTLTHITEIISLFEIAHVSGYISEMNFLILKREYVDLGVLIKTRKEDIESSNVILSQDFFYVPDLYKTHMLKKNEGKKEEVIKDKQETIKDIQKKQYETNKYVEKDKKEKSSSTVRQKSTAYPKTADIKHSNRRSTILELLQKKPFVTVNDVTNAIQGCSGKTLQRELVSLVKDGILKKKGERRWSTYSLA